jgi:glutathione S-transferase
MRTAVLRSPKIPFFIRPITSLVAGQMRAGFLAPEMAKHLAFLESQLETSPANGNYLCGAHLTTADILMSFPLLLARETIAELGATNGQGKLIDQYPKVWAYVKRLEGEPGYKRAEARIKELEKKPE